MFTDRGISVWSDQWEIKPGESIPAASGLQECDIFMLMWSAAAKASRWVDTELRAAICKRVDTALRLIPIMIDETPLPLFVADYREFRLEKADDIDGIVREICRTRRRLT